MTTSITPLGGQQPAPSTQIGDNDLRNVDLDEFLQLLITELQNQDPLNPMENSDILNQISQIREISATDKLSDTLDTVLTGQSLATASGLIGKQVEALSDGGSNVQGVVDRVSVEFDDNDDTKRLLRVHIGEHRISLENVRSIHSGEDPAPAA